MTTACINPSKGRFVHPTEHHGITVRQAARLQTFPDEFDFEGGLIAAGVQIGNAVPVLLAKALCRTIRRGLEATYRFARATLRVIDGVERDEDRTRRKARLRIQ